MLADEFWFEGCAYIWMKKVASNVSSKEIHLSFQNSLFIASKEFISATFGYPITFYIVKNEIPKK